MRITTEDIRVGFHTRQILKGISVDSGNKELVGIIGPNGSGKSTLLKCIYRVLKADSGAVYLDGDELYEEFQRTYDKSVDRDADKEKTGDKIWNNGRGR